MTIYKLPLVALIAQTSYAYRITVFTKSKYIAGVIILVRAFPSIGIKFHVLIYMLGLACLYSTWRSHRDWS